MSTVRGKVNSTTVVESVTVDTTVAIGIERKLEQNGVAFESFSRSTISFTIAHSVGGAFRASIGEDQADWMRPKPRMRDLENSFMLEKEGKRTKMILGMTR